MEEGGEIHHMIKKPNNFFICLAEFLLARFILFIERFVGDQKCIDDNFYTGEKGEKDRELLHYCARKTEHNKKPHVHPLIKRASFIVIAFILTFTTVSVMTFADPFRLVIELRNRIEYAIVSVMTNDKEDGARLERANVDFEVYRLGYIPDGYELENLSKNDNLFHKEVYSKDSNHLVYISQYSKHYEYSQSISDSWNFESTIIDDTEYHYGYNFDSEMNCLYFIKEETLLIIQGTIDKDEVFKIATTIY
jgi:hypothetical protein